VHPRELENMQIPVQWSQWLKYARMDAPSVQELTEDVGRRERMKVLVGLVEDRWRAEEVKAIVSGGVTAEREVEKGGEETGRTVVTQEEVLRQTYKIPKKQVRRAEGLESPWKQASHTKDEPTPWSPKTSQRRDTSLQS